MRLAPEFSRPAADGAARLGAVPAEIMDDAGKVI